MSERSTDQFQFCNCFGYKIKTRKILVPAFLFCFPFLSFFLSFFSSSSPASSSSFFSSFYICCCCCPFFYCTRNRPTWTPANRKTIRQSRKLTSTSTTRRWRRRPSRFRPSLKGSWSGRNGNPRPAERFAARPFRQRTQDDLPRSGR